MEIRNIDDMKNPETDYEEVEIKETEGEKKSPPNLMRRKTWPRLLLCISDIIYWNDGEASKIGEGFFSDVYKFCHRPTGHTVVVKASKQHDECETDQAVMLKEIKVLKKLQHENIIKYLGLCAKDGRFHPVLEFINGGALDELLLDYNIALSWSEKLGFCRDVAKGMKYLHTNHVFHRDLKSANCLVRHGESGSRTVVVADFGLAREVTGDTKTPRKMSMVGTAFWMAPEMLNGKLYNSKADVFSYGILACEIMARVISDPEDLPRTSNFGLDVEKLREKCPNCPKELMDLVKECTEVHNPLLRPEFDEIVDSLEDIESSHDTADYDVIEEILSSIEEDMVTPQCICKNQSVVSHKDTPILPQRHSGLSDDSGFGESDEGSRKLKICLDCQEDDTNNNTVGQNTQEFLHSPPPKKNTSLSRKKVSFKFVSSILTGRRRFRDDVIHEDIAPSKDMSLRRSASLPELKTEVTKPRSRAHTMSTKLSRPKSMFCNKKDDFS
uniref:dual specificity testis-specific protein kinase 2-like n=1 Tax=Styela clava TaxID=7725 RepID=UPI001939A7D3|nr:dual specificity testis-specific protein kinase 2-like [Styela clava]